MHILLKLFILMLFSTMLDALVVDEKSSYIDLLSHSNIFYDRTNSLTFEEAKKRSFEKNSQDVLNLGIAPSTALWIQIKLKNENDKELFKILEYDNPETEEILFFSEDRIIKEGMFHHSKQRKTLNPIFHITLKPYEEKVIYIKAHCKISTMIAKLSLFNEIDFLYKDFEHKLFIFIFFSVIVTLFLYNSLLYVFTKEKAYLYYVTYLFTMMFFESVYLGVAQLYFFSNEISIFITKATIGYISLFVFPIILFAMEFLNTKKFRRLHLTLKSFLYILPAITILSFDNWVFDLNIMIVFFPLAFMLIFSGFYTYSKGVKKAKYYLVGWSAIIISLIFSVSESLGGTQNFNYLNEVAFMFEAFMFSIALAHKIRIISQEKNEADKKLILFQKKEHQLLESIVNSKTKELRDSLQEKEVLYKELHHRVKNNLQMILSLITLQVSTASLLKTKEALSVTQNRIRSIATLYEILHSKEESSSFSTLPYFKSIVSSIQTNFLQEVLIEYDVRHNIFVNDSMYCGLILNELVTNSFKYAFDNHGIIYITTYVKDDLSYMVIADNGRGFSKTSDTSLGLTIVENLIKKQLRGDLLMDIQCGTKITISWSEQ